MHGQQNIKILKFIFSKYSIYTDRIRLKDKKCFETGGYLGAVGMNI